MTEVEGLVNGLSDLYGRNMDASVPSHSRVAWIDFPDHPNIGDSAIWLGQRRWAERRGIAGNAPALPIRALSRGRLVSLREAGYMPILQGGGFFGGLYPADDLIRLEVLTTFYASRVVQAPQSIEFVDAALTARIIAAMDTHPDFELHVRDLHSMEALSEHDPVLTPDAVHCLGMLTGCRPTSRVVVLSRNDGETTGVLTKTAAADWPAERTTARRIRQVRSELSKRMFSARVRTHELDRAAAKRMARGVEYLSRGEVVVTDRLHATLIGLQLGKQVIGIDNRVKKLSRYAATWLTALPTEQLTIVDGADELREILHQRRLVI